MSRPAVDWWAEELDAWALPEQISTSEWADRYRLLSARTTATPGPWRTDRVPYTREVMDAFSDPWVQEITFVASTQVSKTESMLNMLFYAVDQAPGPALVVLPTDTDTTKLFRERLHPAITENPHLERHLTGDPDDVKSQEVRLKQSTIYGASANSPSRLASMPIRYLFMDEVDKYKRFSGAEASPIALARERTRTFWDRKIVCTCTPTTEDGYILTQYAASDRGRFWVPCPHCGGFQVLAFGSIKWPHDVRDPERIMGDRLASYFCPLCGEEIRDRDKPAMLAGYKCVSDRWQTIDPTTGEIRGDKPARVTHRGFWINALYSPWLTWSEIAAEFLWSKDDPARLMNFTNSWLAEPWRDRVESPALEHLLALRGELGRGVVPAGSVAVTLGVDMQKTGFYWCAWAWSAGLASTLVDWGFVTDWAEVGDLVHRRAWPVDQSDQVMGAWRAAIDTGGTADDDGFSRTDEAYSYLRLHGRGVLHGVKGLSTTGGPQRVRHTVLGKRPGQKVHAGLVLWLLDVQAFKDVLFRRLTRGHEFGQAVTLPADVDPAFCEHLLAEEKRRNPRTGKLRWEQIRKANHYLDATVYAHAAADPQWAGGVPALLHRRPAPADVPTRIERPAARAPRPSLW